VFHGHKLDPSSQGIAQISHFFKDGFDEKLHLAYPGDVLQIQRLGME